jgi:hypothetical protein
VGPVVVEHANVAPVTDERIVSLGSDIGMLVCDDLARLSGVRREQGPGWESNMRMSPQ